MSSIDLKQVIKLTLNSANYLFPQSIVGEETWFYRGGGGFVLGFHRGKTYARKFLEGEVVFFPLIGLDSYSNAEPDKWFHVSFIFL